VNLIKSLFYLSAALLLAIAAGVAAGVAAGSLWIGLGVYAGALLLAVVALGFCR
jgi:hypothetical protein